MRWKRRKKRYAKMGWFWSSNAAAKADTPAVPPTSALAPAPAQAPAASSQPSPDKPTDFADAEVQKFVDLFATATDSSSSSPPSASQQSSQPPSRPYWLPAFVTPAAGADAAAASTKSDCPATLSPVAEAVLPTEMSCRQAFDMAFSCNSLGGQWTAVYRTGGMRSCGELWSNFWFCMRHNGSSGPVTENLIREHYRQREWEKYYAKDKKSSEDVWRGRDELVPLDTAFKTPVPSFDDE